MGLDQMQLDELAIRPNCFSPNGNVPVHCTMQSLMQFQKDSLVFQFTSPHLILLFFPFSSIIPFPIFLLPQNVLQDFQNFLSKCPWVGRSRGGKGGNPLKIGEKIKRRKGEIRKRGENIIFKVFVLLILSTKHAKPIAPDPHFKGLCPITSTPHSCTS